MESTYLKLNKISVEKEKEKKGRFHYLSWAWAWHYLKKEYPNANRVVYENESGIPYFTDGQFATLVPFFTGQRPKLSHWRQISEGNAALKPFWVWLIDVGAIPQGHEVIRPCSSSENFDRWKYF